MTDLLTSAQMRAIEQAAIDSGEVSGLELMERAGQGVVEAIFEEWPELAEPVEAGRGASPSSSIGHSDQLRNQGRPPEYLGKMKACVGPWCCAGRATMVVTALWWRAC